MPDDVAASSGITPLQPPPDEPPSVDPQANANDTDEPVENLMADLNDVREELSKIMAEDAEDFKSPMMMGGRVPMTRERLDREKRRSLLQGRENQIQAAIREQTAAPTPIF